MIGAAFCPWHRLTSAGQKYACTAHVQHVHIRNVSSGSPAYCALLYSKATLQEHSKRCSVPEILEHVAGLVLVLSGYDGDVGGVQLGSSPALVAHEACADQRHRAIAIAQSHTTLLWHTASMMLTFQEPS